MTFESIKNSKTHEKTYPEMFGEALIESLIEVGLTDRAEELLQKFHLENSDLAQLKNKLTRTERTASKKSVIKMTKQKLTR